MAEKKLDEPAPKGLEIKGEKGKENITITLGDDVDLGKIITYLKGSNIIHNEEPEENGKYYQICNNFTITIQMSGEKQNDIYGLELKNQNVLFYNTKKQEIHFNVGNKWATGNESPFTYRYKVSNKHILCSPMNRNQTNLLHNTAFRLVKDKYGNLSWFKTTNDGKIYMINNANVKEKDIEDIDNNQWVEISHTYGSNIATCFTNSISDYTGVKDENRPLPIKWFGRKLVGQDGITGKCLWGKGCCGCFNGSGYNESAMYSKEDEQNNGIDTTSKH